MRLSRQLEEVLTERVTGFSKSGERFSVPTPKEMGFKAPKTLVGKLPTGKFHLTKSVVKRLREDYLALMKSGKKVKNQDEAEAIKLLDGSLVKGDELKGIPAHPSTFDWDAGRVRKPERKPVGRVV
jgi:hypothetical protein